MIEKTEILVKGNKLIQRKTLDLPLEDSESIFQQFINHQKTLNYTPLSTDYFHRHMPDLVKRSWLLSKDFNEDYGAVHQINYFPIVGVFGLKINDENCGTFQNVKYWFNFDDLTNNEACALYYIDVGRTRSITEFIEEKSKIYGPDLVLFPNNTVNWSDPRFDLFIANFTPENNKVNFFAIEKSPIMFEGREDKRAEPLNAQQRLVLTASLPNVFEVSTICMGYEYEDKVGEYTLEDRQKYILHMFSSTFANRDLDVDGTKANLIFNVQGEPINLYEKNMFYAPNFSKAFDYGCPFRNVSDRFVIDFTQQYTKPYGLEHS